MHLFHLLAKQRASGGGEREHAHTNENSSICWFILQMPIAIGAGPGASIPVSHIAGRGPSTCAIIGCLPGCTGRQLIWDEDIPGSSLIAVPKKILAPCLPDLGHALLLVWAVRPIWLLVHRCSSAIFQRTSLLQWRSTMPGFGRALVPSSWPFLSWLMGARNTDSLFQK